jgi:prefoldin subunit 5
VGNQSVTEVIKLYPAVLSIIPFMVMQNGTVVDAGNINVPLTSVVLTQGIPASIIAKVEFAGMPISNATVQASSAYPSLVKVLSVSPITSGPYAGDYNITIEAMVVNTTSAPYEVALSINASYMSLTQSVSVLVQAYYNSLAYLQHYIELIQTEINLLNTEIKTLNTSITSLTTSLSSLNQSITTVTNEVNTLNKDLTTVNQTASGLSGTVNSLQTSINTLSTELSSLNTTVNQLKSQVNGILPLVYGGIIAGILGLIVAIIAIVLVYRKIS